jgi:hypothetical protein
LEGIAYIYAIPLFCGGATEKNTPAFFQKQGVSMIVNYGKKGRKHCKIIFSRGFRQLHGR